MNKKKRSLILILEILVLIFLVGGYALYCNKKQASSHFIYKDYEIVITNNEYCKMSHTGTIDIEVRQDNGEPDKLFYTSDDMIHDGANIIFYTDYGLQLQGSVLPFASEAYETKYRDGVQYIKIYYINQSITGKNEWMDLCLVEEDNNENLLSMRIEPDINTDAKRFTYKTQEIYVTKNGIMLNASSEMEMYNSISMITGIMELKWKDSSAEIALRPYAEVAEYSSSGIIDPKVRWAKNMSENYSSRRYYAVELDHWKDIEKIAIGSYTFEASD